MASGDPLAFSQWHIILPPAIQPQKLHRCYWENMCNTQRNEGDLCHLPSCQHVFLFFFNVVKFVEDGLKK